MQLPVTHYLLGVSQALQMQQVKITPYPILFSFLVSGTTVQPVTLVRSLRVVIITLPFSLPPYTISYILCLFEMSSN